MDKIEQYTEEELSSMGWGFKTVETPEPEPVEQKPTIEILRETPDQYVTPYVRISGIELTDKHIVAFYRKSTATIGARARGPPARTTTHRTAGGFIRTTSPTRRAVGSVRAR